MLNLWSRRSLLRIAAFGFPCVFVFVLDRLLKAWALREFPGTSVNSGIALGIGKDLTNCWWIWFTFQILALSAFVTLFVKKIKGWWDLLSLSRRHVLPWLTVAYLGEGVVIGGAIGNLYDRMTLHGVVDFVRIFFFPAFNFADLSISMGLVVVALSFIMLSRIEGGVKENVRSSRRK